MTPKPSPITAHDLALIRRAVMTVLDDFGSDGSGLRLFSKSEDELIAARMLFTDRVQELVTRYATGRTEATR
jgi:hypothetical protein